MTSPLSTPLSPVVHPILVHFTAALFPIVALLATYAAWRRAEWASRATRWLLGLAVLVTLLTIATGLVEGEPYEDRLEGTEAGEVIETHELLGFATEIVFLVAWALLRWRPAGLLGPRRFLFVGLLWLGVAVVTVGGWMGGRLVYEFGVGTPDGP